MAVVLVNYRTGVLAIDCLASLEAEVHAVPALSVSVVDNDSGDGSADVIAAAIAARGWDHWVTLIRSPRNGGFAAGNNMAIRALMRSEHPPDLIWLLNPDTRVMPGGAAAISAFMADRREVGIIGTALIEEGGAPWPYAFRFPTIASEIERGSRLGIVSRLLSRSAVLRRMDDGAGPVDWVSGASMIVRARVFEQIGLMDEGYFLYFEETDLCRTAGLAGWSTWYMPDAAVIHLAGQSTGLTDNSPKSGRVPAYWFESRRRYFVKNHGRGYAVVADLAWTAAHLFWRLRRLLVRMPDLDPPALLSDFWRRSAIMSGAGRG